MRGIFDNDKQKSQKHTNFLCPCIQKVPLPSLSDLRNEKFCIKGPVRFILTSTLVNFAKF
jgi:hypothetical protein